MLLGYLHYVPVGYARLHSLCAYSRPEAIKGSSSSCSLILSRLLASPVQTQLALTDPQLGAPVPLPPKWRSSHRVRALSLLRVQNMRIRWFHFRGFPGLSLLRFAASTSVISPFSFGTATIMVRVCLPAFIREFTFLHLTFWVNFSSASFFCCGLSSCSFLA
jgi:hypothetical protein